MGHLQDNLSVLDFLMCTECKIVDQFAFLMGGPCPKCGRNNPYGPNIYFPAGVDISIELMQEFSQSKTRNHSLAVVVFFCTLGEVLLQNFLVRYMAELGKSHEEQKKLFTENLGVSKRVKELFPKLTNGVQWKKALEAINIRKDIDYLELNRFYRQAVNVRNNFLHKGDRLTDPRNLAEECVRRIWPMLYMFMDLHNRHVANVTKANP